VENRRYLYHGRINSHLSLEQIGLRTAISPSILRNIDEGRFELLPSGLYARSYIRAFAAAVGLDPEAALAAVEPYLPGAPDPLAQLNEARGSNPVERLKKRVAAVAPRLPGIPAAFKSPAAAIDHIRPAGAALFKKLEPWREAVAARVEQKRAAALSRVDQPPHSDDRPPNADSDLGSHLADLPVPTDAEWNLDAALGRPDDRELDLSIEQVVAAGPPERGADLSDRMQPWLSAATSRVAQARDTVSSRIQACGGTLARHVERWQGTVANGVEAWPAAVSNGLNQVRAAFNRGEYSGGTESAPVAPWAEAGSRETEPWPKAIVNRVGPWQEAFSTQVEPWRASLVTRSMETWTRLPQLASRGARSPRLTRCGAAAIDALLLLAVDAFLVLLISWSSGVRVNVLLHEAGLALGSFCAIPVALYFLLFGGIAGSTLGGYVCSLMEPSPDHPLSLNDIVRRAVRR
jgi:hypothetical protein